MGKILGAWPRAQCLTLVSGALSDNVNFCDHGFTATGIDVTTGQGQGFLSDPAAAPLVTPYNVPAGNAFYFHGALGYGTSGFTSNVPVLTLLDSAGHPWIELTDTGQLQFNSGTGTSPAWSPIGPAHGLPGYTAGGGTGADIDIKLDIDAGGNHTILLAYNRAAVVGPVTFTANGLTDIHSFTLATVGSFTTVWSQVFCTENWSTIGGHVACSRATAAGTHSDWAGTYTDVNEIGDNDTTANQATTAGLVQSYPMSNIAVPSGYLIASVFNWVRIKSDGSSPANVQSVCRPVGTDYTSADLTTPLVTYSGVCARYDVNPETGTDWSGNDWNAPTQLGFKSAA